MGDSDRAFRFILPNAVLEGGNLAYGASPIGLPMIENRNSAGVVAPVFQSLQTLDQYIPSW
jgi:hypothetical protein